MTPSPAGQYDIGDMVFCRDAIYNDGGIPDVAEEALLATSGARGVVVKFGHVEADKKQEIYLVRFEGSDGTLGPPIGILPEELTQDEAEAKRLAELN
jgi:nitrogen fixation protein NifZ